MIRPARPDEQDYICQQVAAMDPWKSLDIQPETMAKNIRFDTIRRILVAEENGQIAGVVMFRDKDYAQLLMGHGFGQPLARHHNIPWPCDWTDLPNGGYISGLAIFPHAQGRGLGTALIHAAEAQIQSAGQTHTYIMVSHCNPRARQLYERQGYNLIATIDNCLKPGNTEHLLEKIFSKSLPIYNVDITNDNT